MTTADPDAPERASRDVKGERDGSSWERWIPGAKATIALGIIAFFVGTYTFNAMSFARDSLRGDQWVWVESVLIPFHRGDMGLFDALTYEYAPLSHSHIPALAVFLFSFEFLDLSVLPDRIIGVLSLAVILFLVFRYLRGFLSSKSALLVTAVASSMLFMSSAAPNFVWSLLQFQMFYVLVAFVYLRTFVAHHAKRPVLHALVAMPLTLLLGDAIGVAAVAASLGYLGILTLMRRAPLRSLLVYYGTLPLQLLAMSAFVRGERVHTGTSSTNAVEHALGNPVEALKGIYFALAGAFVALRPPNWTSPLLSWRHAPLWFALTIAVGAAAVLLLRRSELRHHDHFPILIGLTGGVWILGVLKARLVTAGPAVMQSNRYAPYTALVGLGLFLFLVSKSRYRPNLRLPLVGLGAVLVLVNGLGSYRVADNGNWVDQQDREIADVRSFALDETQDFRVGGGRCTRDSCLRAALFLHDQQVGPFRDGVPRAPRWQWQLGELVFTQLQDMNHTDRALIRKSTEQLDDEALVAWIFREPPFHLATAARQAGIEISGDRRTEAERVAVRALRAATDQSTASRP